MKKSNVTDVMLAVGDRPNQRIVAIGRGTRVRYYYGVSIPSVFRLTRAVSKRIDEKSVTLYPMSFGWFAVFPTKQ
jgi:hypothetical protein